MGVDTAAGHAANARSESDDATGVDTIAVNMKTDDVDPLIATIGQKVGEAQSAQASALQVITMQRVFKTLLCNRLHGLELLQHTMMLLNMFKMQRTTRLT